MSHVVITFPDGAKREYPKETTIADIAASISPSLLKRAVAGAVDGKLVDLDHRVQNDAHVEIITMADKRGLEVYRHSTAHLMAQAIKRIYGADKVRLGVGPVIEDGFYYDIDLDHSITPEDLEKIEEEMRKIVKEDLPIRRVEVSREEAEEIYRKVGDPYKLELIRDLPEGETISIYEQGEFFDLCRGPHLPSTGKIKAFKLLSVAGAYWRGDSKNKMLQRIYGTAFEKQGQLEEHLKLLEEAKKRDHRKLGKELEAVYVFGRSARHALLFAKRHVVRNELETFLAGTADPARDTKKCVLRLL